MASSLENELVHTSVPLALGYRVHHPLLELPFLDAKLCGASLHAVQGQAKWTYDICLNVNVYDIQSSVDLKFNHKVRSSPRVQLS